MAKASSPESPKFFFDLIRNDPLNARHYRELAKWFDSKHDSRADAVRLGIKRRKLICETIDPFGVGTDFEFKLIEDAHSAMNHQFKEEWNSSLPKIPGIEYGKFDGGLVDQIVISEKVSVFRKSSSKLFEATPACDFEPPYDSSQKSLEEMFSAPGMAELEALVLGDQHQSHVARALAASPQMNRLKMVWFRNNRLVDRDIQAMAESAHLRTVNSLSLCSNRDLTGKAVTAIGNSPYFKNLQHLNIESIEFGKDGGLSLARAENFEKLKRLEIAHAGLKNAGWKAIVDSRKLDGIKWLDIGGNRLNAETLEYFFKKTDLTKLTSFNHYHFLDNCDIKTFHKTDLPKLKQLQLYNLTDAAVSSLAKSNWTSGLRKLKLSFVAVSKSSAKKFATADFSKLQVLELQSIAEPHLLALAKNPTLSKLKILSVTCESLSDAAKSKILGGVWTKKLEFLRVAIADCDDMMAGEIANCKHLSRLKNLYLESVFSTTHREKRRTVRHWVRTKSKMTDRGMFEIAGSKWLQKLESLKVHCGEATDQSVKKICGSPIAARMKILSLSGTNFSDESLLAIIQSMPNLNQLLLNSSPFSSSAVAKLLAAENLNQLHQCELDEAEMGRLQSKFDHRFPWY